MGWIPFAIPGVLGGPPPEPPGPPDPVIQSLASSPVELLGLLDLSFDPVTRDLVDTEDGALLETTDRRTAVIFQIESALNAWWGDPTQGSRIKEIISGAATDESGDIDVGDINSLIDEVKRCMQVLVDESVVFDLSVAVDSDETGRPVILLNYRDPTTGTPVDLAYVPFSP